MPLAAGTINLIILRILDQMNRGKNQTPQDSSDPLNLILAIVIQFHSHSLHPCQSSLLRNHQKKPHGLQDTRVEVGVGVGVEKGVAEAGVGVGVIVDQKRSLDERAEVLELEDMGVHDGTQVHMEGGPKVLMDAKTKVRTDKERKVRIIGGGKVRTIRKESLLLIYLQGGAKNGVMIFRSLKLGNRKPN